MQRSPFQTLHIPLILLSVFMVAAPSSSHAAADAATHDDTASATIDASSPGTAFPHVWEQSFGSDRADMVLTQSYLTNADKTEAATGFHYVRFHGILGDSMGIVSADSQGHVHYNFRKVDAVYDALQQHHLRPLVELSFMPSAIGSDVLRRDGGLEPLVKWKAQDPLQPVTDYSGGSLWYRANVTPPARMADWNALIHAFVTHLEQRYGRDEVQKWPFEVWNEPDQATWTGHPKMQTYFALYDNTARTIKSVDPALKVGGPATGAIHWVGDFVDHVTRNHVPVDFISTHIYANDPPALLKLPQSPANTGNTVCDATRSARNVIDHAGRKDLPLYITEFGADWDIHDGSADRAWVAPWLAETVRDCDGLSPIMSYWTFSDDFEEQGVLSNELPGAYGLLTTHGIPKPAFNAFELLHELGKRRLETASDAGNVLATRRKDGTITVALWNRDTDHVRDEHLSFKGLTALRGATLTILDRHHGTPADRFDAMGHPDTPTPQQVAALTQAAALPAAMPARTCTSAATCEVQLPPESLALLVIPAGAI